MERALPQRDVIIATRVSAACLLVAGLLILLCYVSTRLVEPLGLLLVIFVAPYATAALSLPGTVFGLIAVYRSERKLCWGTLTFASNALVLIASILVAIHFFKQGFPL